MILRCRFAWTGGTAIVRDAEIAIASEDGRIAYVGPRRAEHDSAAENLGDVLLLPGLINAHTHLELTALAGMVPPSSDFTDWLARLIAARKELLCDEASIDHSVREGIRQALRAGTTTVGDITTQPALTRRALAESPLRAVSFGEVIAIGRLREQLDQRLAAAAVATVAGQRLRIGISPHSPYTVDEDALAQCAKTAQRDRLPLCIHLCETAEEAEFTQSGSGSLAEYLQRLSVIDASADASRCSPVELLQRCGLLTRRTIAAHGNYVTSSEIELLATTGTSVAYCPRTHAAFSHRPHPFQEMMNAGVNVCIGTDSLASNPSLSVLDELRFMHRSRPEIAPDMLFTMATANGARALAWADSIGSLAAGMLADMIAIPLSAPDAASPLKDVLAGSAEPMCVWIGGRRIPDEPDRPDQGRNVTKSN